MADAFRETLGSPLHRDLYDYWRSIAPAGVLPGRQHFRPEDIPHLLANLYLRDVVRDGGEIRFRTRLMGTRLVTVLGRDTTGRFMDEIFDADYVVRQRAIYLRVIATGAPDLLATQAPVHDKEHIRYQRLLLPLAEDGRTVDILVGLLAFIR